MEEKQQRTIPAVLGNTLLQSYPRGPIPLVSTNKYSKIPGLDNVECGSLYTFCRILRPGHLKISTICQVPCVTASSLSANKKKHTKTSNLFFFG